jgi:carboxypeptidase C (cathepsin A)
MGLLQENGPCFISADSNSTYHNPHSWNNNVNMLYIDQPNQVGFSYDMLTNGTIALGREDLVIILPTDFSSGVPEQNNTLLVGTFASQNQTRTANTTVAAAHAMWHFLQVWLSEFPEYKTEDQRVSLWTESYGGRYGPAFARHFVEMDEKVANETEEMQVKRRIGIDTLGIVNGCLDSPGGRTSYPEFAFNNVSGYRLRHERGERA